MAHWSSNRLTHAGTSLTLSLESFRLARKWTHDCSSNRIRLNKDAGPKPVLGSSIGASIRESQLTNMPISRISRSRRTDSRNDGSQRIRAVTGPQSHRLGVEINIIRKVVPVAGFKLRGPLCRSTHAPAEGVVLTGRVAAQQAVF